MNDFPHLENVVEFHVDGVELTQGEPSRVMYYYVNLTEGRPAFVCFRNIRGLKLGASQRAPSQDPMILRTACFFYFGVRA
jgi:hypothetical protein